MSQHIINCPKCGKTHEVDVLRNGGKPVALISVDCKFFTEDVTEIRKLTQTSNMNFNDLWQIVTHNWQHNHEV